MKNIKKIRFSLGIFLLMCVVAVFAAPAHRALAAGASSGDDVNNCTNNLKFVSIAEVDCTFTPTAGGSATTVKFIDKNPTDSSSHHNYVMNYAQQGDYFCESGGITHSTDNGGAFDRYYPIGITIKGDGPLSVSVAGSNVKLSVNEGYSDASTGQCAYPKGHSKDNLPSITLSGADTQNVATVLQYSPDGSAVEPLDGVTDGDLSNNYTLVGNYNYGTYDAYTNGFTPGTCNGEVIMADSSNNMATRFSLNTDNKSLADHPALLDFLNKQSTSGCYIHESQTNYGLGGTLHLAGTPPSSTVVAAAPVAGSSGACQGTSCNDSGSACAANSGGFPFAWAFCPILDAASSLSTQLINLFEGQLSFKVSDLSTPNAATNGETEVHAAWSLIRDIASSALVILMLFMVLSQAASWSPLDAYTIKKILPKMIIAVIGMQFSWDLCSYVVGLFDDVGHGLANLLYFPFGGVNQMDLWHLLKNAGIGGITAGTMDWAAVGLGLFLGYAFVFTMLGTATTAVLALLAGLFTLVFRKTLIIMLLILSPLALIAWILPGTQTYWKMWRENFTKALMMYPLAVGLIASGRIFAQVAGSQNHETGGSFLNLIFVMVGYFGPLFILPKTFKWGGQAMNLAGQNISKAGQKINERPKKFFDKRQEGWNHYREELSQQRVANNEGFNPKKITSYWNTPLDKFRSGKWDPTYGKPHSDRRQRAIDSYVERGEKSEQESVNAAEARLVRERQKYRAEGGNHDIYLQAISDGLEKFTDPTTGKEVTLGKRNEVERIAARKQLAKLGAGMNWRYLENYYERTTKNARDNPHDEHAQEEAASARKFFDDNVDLIIGKLPHIYKSLGQAADADPGAIAGMHGVEVEAILAGLSNRINTASDPATKRGHEASLTTFLQNFQRAVENSQRGGPQLENGTLRAVKGFLDRDDNVASSLIESINDDPDPVHPERSGVHGRKGNGRAKYLPGEAPRVLPLLVRSNSVRFGQEAEGQINALQDSLASMIDEAGYVRNVTNTSPAAQVAQAIPTAQVTTVSPQQSTGSAAQATQTAAAATHPQASSPGQAASSAPPVVNVTIDHEAMGQAFANSMRNVLQHTTLKVEHTPGGGPSANQQGQNLRGFRAGPEYPPEPPTSPPPPNNPAGA